MMHTTGRLPIVKLTGRHAEDKDIARHIRKDVIFPNLRTRTVTILDFAGVDFATQSFVHACLSEAIRKYGEEALDLIEFHKCKKVVKSVVLTVVEYSLQFAVAEAAGSPQPLSSRDIPQAESLHVVRKVVAAVSRRLTSIHDIGAATGLSPRHVYYRLRAAIILGLVSPPPERDVSAQGKRLLGIKPGSRKEQECFKESIERSAVFQLLVPDLFEHPAPRCVAIASRIRKLTNLSQATAMRRGATLLSWRRQVGVHDQLSLEFFFESG